MMCVIKIVHDAVFGVVRDRRGTVATFLAASIIPLIAFTGLAVDTARGYLMKSRLSYALDAAGLAGGRALSNPNADVNAVIAQFFSANFPAGYMGATLDGPNVVMGSGGDTITLNATATMGTSLMRVLGMDDMLVAGNTEVTLSSVNLEVSLVLDITGSMQDEMDDLRTAATDLVNIIVKDSQTPFFSKVALVPYAAGVNLGGYAVQARGAIRGPKAITNATRADPVVVTAPGHDLQDGEPIYIASVNGMTELNNRYFRVSNPNWTTGTFELRNFSDSDDIDGDGYNSYTSGGTVSCRSSGCDKFLFLNVNNDWKEWTPSTCATERTGTEAYTDAAPSTSLVSPHYSDSSNPCPPNVIVPLTSNKTTLTNAIAALDDGGSTAGQIGLAWGWYMISPNFAYMFSGEGQPLAYDPETLTKVVIFMTDGELNTAYTEGVVAQNSGSGSGSDSDKIKKNATNGSSFNQALTLCSAMKAAGILIYTVGFNVGAIPAAEDLVRQCATDPSYVYLPEGGTELSAAFNAIAVNVSQLRLSR